MNQFTFDHLISRFGEIAAWHHLVEIEKAAGLQPQHSIHDPEARLAKAIRVQDQKYLPTFQIAA